MTPVNKNPPGVAILGADHVYRWANPAHIMLTGWDLPTLRALSHLDTIAAEDVDAELAALSPLHAGRCEVVTWRRRFGREDGVRCWCGVTAHAVRNADGSLHEMIWIVEPDVLVPGEPAADSDTILRQLRADHELIAGVLSHDGVQPTRMISSYAGLIEQRLRDGPAASELGYLASIQRANDELRELLRETVDYLRVPDHLEAGIPSNLRRCAETVVMRLAESLPGLHLQVISDLDITIESEHLEQCLRAALIFIWARSLSGSVEVRGSSRPGWLHITIVAPGAKLYEGDTDRIFKVGARISLANHLGTRLPGLAVARRIARSTGGDVTITGTDTAVMVTLSFTTIL